MILKLPAFSIYRTTEHNTVELILVAATQTFPPHPVSTCRPSRLDNKPPERYWWMCEHGRGWGLGKLNWGMNVGILNKTPLFSSSKSSSLETIESVHTVHYTFCEPVTQIDCPSLQDGSYSAGQETSCRSRNLQIQCRVQKNSPLVPIWARWIQRTTSHPIYLESILILALPLLPVLPSTSFLQIFKLMC
jgi:hypothetical protein